MVDEGTTHPRGEALLAELLFIHGLIRQNLDEVSDLVEQVAAGAPVEQIQTRLDELASTSMVWRLRESCVQYCYFVHLHHRHEDVSWFPALRGVNPQLHPIIDRLEADHALVSDLLDEVEAAARRVGEYESARAELAAALSSLAGHLLSHLDYEETNLGPTLRRLRSWPPGR